MKGKQKPNDYNEKKRKQSFTHNISELKEDRLNIEEEFSN